MDHTRKVRIEFGAVVVLILLLFVWYYNTPKNPAGSFENTAVAVNQINVTGCVPLPRVAKISPGTAVEFVNNDPTPHQIYFSPKYNYVIEANQKKSVSLNFLKVGAVTRYSCDDDTGLGNIYVVKN